MADKDIKITIRERRAIVEGSPVIVCGNSGYTLTFTFDDEWEQTGAKTARFVYVKDGEVKHEDIVFTGIVADVPILSNVAFVKVGVFAGDLRTTTPARINCELSILCGSGKVEEPTPDVYNQIMALLNDMTVNGGNGATEEQMKRVADNEQAIQDLKTGATRAGDAEKLGGQLPSYYATAQSVADLEDATVESLEDIVDGTTKAGKAKEADNASKLDNLTAKEIGASGARNLIPYPYYQTTRNVNGIDFTDLGDGRIHAKGTATASATFVVKSNNENWTVTNGTYTLSGCPSGGSFSTYRLQIARHVNGTLTSYTNDYGNGATTEITDGLPILIQIVIASGVTIDAIFEPMLERGSVKHDYVPYYHGGAERALKADNSSKLNGKSDSDFLSVANGGTIAKSITVNAGSSYSALGNERTQNDGTIYGVCMYTGNAKDAQIQLKDVTNNAIKAILAIKENDATIRLGSNTYSIIHTGNSSPVVPTNVDPGVGASVTYADGTVIFVYEEE